MKIASSYFAALALSAIAAGNAAAMTLSSRGMGQVLEFPYYTVNGNQQTLLTVVNCTEAVKALKVRLREAFDGRPVQSFDLYLGPFDVWTGGVVLDNEHVVLATRDHSCTVPAFDSSVSSLHIPAVLLSTASFSGADSDGGPTDASRLHEGHIEVFEMGEVTSDAHGLMTATYVHSDDTPLGCDKLVAAWNTSGVWTTNPATDLGPPNGGLFGSSAVVNVANGTYFAIEPSVIDGFSNTVQHTAPTAATPDFDTASADADGEVAASVDVGSQVITAKFGFPEDAVSALFMASQAINEFVATATVGEQTDWVATFPTKRFYVDSALSQSNQAIRPFDTVFAKAPTGAGQSYVAGACVNYVLSVFNREELTLTPYGCGFSGCPPIRTFCHETSVIPLSASGSALHTALNENALVYDLQTIDQLAEGYIEFDVQDANQQHRLLSDDGIAFAGLPMISFVAENYVNGNVTPGVLANYSAVLPQRSILKCSRIVDGQDTACP